MKMVTCISFLGMALFQCVLADESLDAEFESVNEKVEAEYRLGEFYRTDNTIGPDLNQAAVHYRLAADRGHSLAQFELASMYYDGAGVSKDHGRAAKYMQMAADQKLPAAQFAIGYMYAIGEGVKQDYAVSLANFRTASSNGYLNADLLIGDMYAQGLGVEKDLNLAFKWYDEAAQQGTSREFIATAKKARDEVARLAGIKIQSKIVPMEGSGFLTLYEGRLIEYDPILSDIPVYKASPVVDAEAGSVHYIDWWKGEKPKYRYVNPNPKPRKKPKRSSTASETVNPNPTERNNNCAVNYGICMGSCVGDMTGMCFGNCNAQFGYCDSLQ
jgi:hypothetical protein